MVATHGAGWTLADCLIRLVADCDAYAPGRSHASDGSIGDIRHAAEGKPTYDPTTGHHLTGTEHLADNRGIVCAVDLTHDPAHGFDCQKIAAAITNDARVDYLELENVTGGRKLEYKRGRVIDVGPSGSSAHLHVSVLHLDRVCADVRSWLTPSVPVPALEVDMEYWIPGDGTTYLAGAGVPIPMTADDKSAYDASRKAAGLPVVPVVHVTPRMVAKASGK